MNVWTTMQHSSEMILFIIFHFILRVDCHLAVSCGNPFALVRFLWWAMSLLCSTVKYHFWPDDSSSRFLSIFLSFCMKLGMVDTFWNRFLSLPKTLDVLDNKSISEISLCTMQSFNHEISYHYYDDFETFTRWKCSAWWNWKVCLVWTGVRCICVEDQNFEWVRYR